MKKKCDCPAEHPLEIPRMKSSFERINTGDRQDGLFSMLETRSRDLELLLRYTLYLEKHHYIDTDWRDEPPSPIDEFMREEDKAKLIELLKP